MTAATQRLIKPEKWEGICEDYLWKFSWGGESDWRCAACEFWRTPFRRGNEIRPTRALSPLMPVAHEKGSEKEDCHQIWSSGKWFCSLLKYCQPTFVSILLQVKPTFFLSFVAWIICKIFKTGFGKFSVQVDKKVFCSLWRNAFGLPHISVILSTAFLPWAQKQPRLVGPHSERVQHNNNYRIWHFLLWLFVRNTSCRNLVAGLLHVWVKWSLMFVKTLLDSTNE